MRSIVVLLALASCRPPAVGKPTSSSKLEFDVVPDESEHAFSTQLFDSHTPDSMTFTVAFRNGLKEPVTVCTAPITTMTIANVRFRDETVKPEISEVSFEVWPGCSPRDLVRLDQGQAAYYTLSGLNSYRLAPGASPQVFEWYPVGWGEYRVDFRYHYDGPDYGKPNVFRGTLEANDVRFSIN